MVIILPDEIEGIKEVENNLEKFNLDYEQSFGNISKREVRLFLPKFKIETSIDLNETLQQVTLLFQYYNFSLLIT